MRDRAGLVIILLLASSAPARAADIPWGRVMNASPGARSRADRARVEKLLREIVMYHGRKDHTELRDRLEEELMLLRGGK